MREAIVWKSVDEEMPDDGIDVLVLTTDQSRPVWIAVHDGDDGWWWCDMLPINKATVLKWAEMPEGQQS